MNTYSVGGENIPASSKKVYVMDHLDQVSVILVRDACGTAQACLLLNRLARAHEVYYSPAEVVQKLDCLNNKMVYGTDIISFHKDNGKIMFYYSTEFSGTVALTPNTVKGWPVEKTAKVQEACIKLLLKVCPEDLNLVEWF